MKILTADPPPEEMEEVLARRKALGQDLYDEVWEGVYHMVPVPHPWHGAVQAEVMMLVGRAADERGLIATGPFNLGEENDYRCPDGGVHQNMPVDLYVPTALIVVEIVSPDDDTFHKFDFYWEHQVQEILTIERDAEGPVVGAPVGVPSGCRERHPRSQCRGPRRSDTVALTTVTMGLRAKL